MGRDKLILQGLRLYGRHGVHKAEQSLGQQFRVDVEVHANVRKACRSDDFRDTLDYVKVFTIAKSVVESEPRQLVESVAEEIAATVLKELQAAEAIKVKVMKPHVALPAVLDGIGVEIWREREDSDEFV